MDLCSSMPYNHSTKFNHLDVGMSRFMAWSRAVILPHWYNRKILYRYLRLLAKIYMLWKYIGILHPLKWHEDYLKLKSLNKSPSKFLLLILKVPPQKYRCHKSPLWGVYQQEKKLIISTRMRGYISKHCHKVSYLPFVSLKGHLSTFP